MCASVSNVGVLFWVVGIAIAFVVGRLMESAHQENVELARGDLARKAVGLPVNSNHQPPEWDRDSEP